MRLLAALLHRFFAPAPLLDLAIVRVLVVALQLFVMLVPYALFTYPVWGRLELLAALPDSKWEPLPIVRALLLPFFGGERPPLQAMLWLQRATIAAGVLALIGWSTRSALLVFALGNLLISGYGYSFQEHHHIEALTIVLLFALALAPSGSALAVDAWRARRCGAGAAATALHPEAGWPLELLRWMFALCYLSAAACKLGASGLAWLNGFTLQGYLLQEGIFWGTASSAWLADHHRLCVALSWFALLVEGLFFLVLWKRGLAWFFVPAAAALHLGIWITMRAPFWLYLPLYAVFVPWSSLFARFARVAPAEAARK